MTRNWIWLAVSMALAGCGNSSNENRVLYASGQASSKGVWLELQNDGGFAGGFIGGEKCEGVFMMRGDTLLLRPDWPRDVWLAALDDKMLLDRGRLVFLNRSGEVGTSFLDLERLHAMRKRMQW
jgi:hypothetical protein